MECALIRTVLGPRLRTAATGPICGAADSRWKAEHSSLPICEGLYAHVVSTGMSCTQDRETDSSKLG